MLELLSSFRTRLVLVMVATAAVALAAAVVVVGRVQASQERPKDLRKAKTIAVAIAKQAETAPPERFAALQAVLPGDRITVVRDGKVVFSGPPRRGEVEVTATALFPRGRVTVLDTASKESETPLIVALGAIVAAVVAAAVVAAALMARAFSRPLDRAIAAADRVAAGDLSARMEVTAPEEFAHLARAFDDMAARLESADRDQREFLADVAHEIATPVSAVAGFAIALADGTIRSDEERTEAAEVIEREVARLESLVESFRQLTRLDLVDDGASDDVDVDAALGDVAARFRPAARDGGIEVIVRPSRLRVPTDGRLLDTVLDNLVSNAVRYTPAGGRVVLSARRGRDGVSIAVGDTGIGIAPEHQSRVFDRLYRVDPARARASGGSGLGLAIAQRAAHALGGRLELTSERGRGTEFRLVLPLRRRRGAQSAASTAARSDAT